MNKVVIHAGLPKTATSFLQEKVFPYLPKDECAFNPDGLNRILIEMSKEAQSGRGLDDRRISQIKTNVDRELELVEAPVLLLSVEGLMPLHCSGFENTERILDALRKLFPGAEIVVFLREQLAWFRSAYSFCLVSKYVLPFDEFVCRSEDGELGGHVHDGLGVCVFDYEFDRIRRTVEQYFPVVRFFSFEELFSERQEQVLARLASVLNVSAIRVEASGEVNKGLDETLMVRISETARRIPFRDRWHADYLYLKYSKIRGFRKLKYLYLRKSGQLAMCLAKRTQGIFGKAGRQLFSKEEARRIRNHYQQGNVAFWESYGCGSTSAGEGDRDSKED